ncbi:MAG: (2Fe-2S)-binding protein [Dehalococcoidia bacterium]|jgi:carbon-monoxide dehydrogenase small subunit|nr:(2Fe-2S)-binding protein [Dehalococcoidia bacterium]
MKRVVTLTVNGEQRQALAEPRVTLLELLRDGLGLTGSKEGCGDGNCGACTVLLNGRPVNSCLVLAVEVDGSDVFTIEGLARSGALHPLQQAFIDHGGLQCGFCTPGLVMVAYALLQENPHPTEQEVRMAIAGNLCRCTGYDKVVRAVMAVG